MADDYPTTGLGTMVDYAAISGGIAGDPATIVALLALLNREDALYHCARVSTAATGFDLGYPPLERQRALVTHYFSKDQIELINRFAVSHGGVSKVAVFFRGQLLELARWVSRYCGDRTSGGATFESADVRHAFAAAAVIASDLWNRRIYGDKLAPIDDGDEQLRRALGPFRKGMEESGQADHPGTAMGRGWLIFTRFLPAHLPDFPRLFAERTGLTIEQYFTCAVALMLYTFPKNEGGPAFNTDHVAAGTPVKGMFDRFLALRGQTPDELETTLWDKFGANDYKGLRMRPILNFSQKRSVILDADFYTEGVAVSPLFDVLTMDNHKLVLGKFGNAFEDYILEYLREMFPSRPGLVDRLTTNVKGQNGNGQKFECDAILNDGPEVFVAEIKASWIREDSILTEDPGDFEQQLLSRYGLKDGEHKGVAQLARSIGAVIRGEWTGPNKELTAARTLYPVLVVHDERLSYPGTTAFLNKEFRRCLGDVPAGKRVESVIILTVADIENLASSVENFGFAEMVRDYAVQCPARNDSVLNFLYHSRYGALVKPAQKLCDTTEAIMSALKQTLFPKDAAGSTES